MLPTELIQNVPTSYDKAFASGDLLFFSSTVHVHPEAGINVLIDVQYTVPYH
jgi:sulfate adenylyltransferase (ADP) / ATP adenylyltransferase